MKKKLLNLVICLALVSLHTGLSSAAQPPHQEPMVKRAASSGKSSVECPIATYDERSVRYILADIQIGHVASFYRGHSSPNDKEAIRRWDAGVRVANINKFDRVVVWGKSWQIVYKGTTRTVNPTDIMLRYCCCQTVFVYRRSETKNGYIVKANSELFFPAIF